MRGTQLLTRSDSISGWAADNGLVDPGPEQPSFDRYLRGIVTATGVGAEHERALAKEPPERRRIPRSRPRWQASSSTLPATRPG